MAKLHARNTKVELNYGGTTWYDISDMCTSLTLDDQTEAADVTAFGSDGYKEFIDGFTEGSFSVEGWYDSDLYAHVIAARTAATKQIRVRPNGDGSGQPQMLFSFTGIQLSTTFNVSDPSGASFSGTITGAIDYDNQ